MTDRTQALDQIMRANKLTARDVGAILHRAPHTVRCWRSRWAARTIPEHALALLQTLIASGAHNA